MAEHEQGRSEEFADLFGLNSLSEDQLDSVVGGAHSLEAIQKASKGWYDLYRSEGMSVKDAMKSVYVNNLSADDQEAVKPVLIIKGIIAN